MNSITVAKLIDALMDLPSDSHVYVNSYGHTDNAITGIVERDGHHVFTSRMDEDETLLSPHLVVQSKPEDLQTIHDRLNPGRVKN